MDSGQHTHLGSMSDVKRILVTGATGFIGSAISKRLKKEGFQVTTTTRTQSEADGANILYLDLSKPETFSRLTNDQHFDAIVHFGAHIGWSGESEEELFVPNVIATGLLANLALITDSQFIFSSAAILCGVKAEKTTQDSPVNADTPYSKSKWLAEELVKASGTRHCILRIGGVFGLNGPNHLGLNRAISGAINQIAPQLHGSGNAQRNYIYLWDVAETVAYIIRNNIGGTHLLAGSERRSIRSMLEEVCEVFMPEVNLVQYSDGDTIDQLILPSGDLPKTRSFRSALEDIRDRAVEK
jgi:nucleoside-diphosphate-sugar epimerase